MKTISPTNIVLILVSAIMLSAIINAVLMLCGVNLFFAEVPTSQWWTALSIVITLVAILLGVSLYRARNIDSIVSDVQETSNNLQKQ